MVVDSDKVLFFFGAGGSAEFGIPPMRKMAEDFKSIITQQNLSEERDAYNEIVKMLKDDMGPDVDIEAIFSVIDGLQEYNIENIGELSIYILRSSSKIHYYIRRLLAKRYCNLWKKIFKGSLENLVH
jgi:hypothetical protein